MEYRSPLRPGRGRAPSAIAAGFFVLLGGCGGGGGGNTPSPDGAAIDRPGVDAGLDGRVDSPADGSADVVVDAGIDVSGPMAIPPEAWKQDLTAAGNTDGVPLGGFGAGTVTWRWDGAFYKGRLRIGNDDRTVDPDSGFAMYQRPAGGTAWAKRLDAASLGAGQATYHALVPRAWVDYSGAQFGCKAKVQQLTPAIPGDQKLLSYPVGVFRWEVSNPGTAACEVAVMLTWKNDLGGPGPVEAKTTPAAVTLRLGRAATALPSSENDAEFALAVGQSSGVTVTYQTGGSRAELDAAFGAAGTLGNTTSATGALGAVAFKATVAPGGRITVPMALAWDIPIAQPGGGNKWYREYTRTWGRTGTRAAEIAADGVARYLEWEEALTGWQQSVLSNTRYPAWLKTMLFNELYYFFVGGTIWEAGAASGQADDPDEDMFSSLECYEYPFYGTSDVRFYGSWALAMLWPDLDKQEVKQFCDSVALGQTRTDRPAPLGTTAHDFGGRADVFKAWNAYNYRDSTQWKDLNSKLVLMVYRDWALTGKNDSAFLQYCWPAVKTAMAKVKSQDSDGDGLPNSNGIDQTYDDMSLTGNTAYCGSLFLAAAEAAKELATVMGDSTLATQYQTWLETGKVGFEKLWNGTYYDIDTGSSDTSRIMADQLAGQWYARACGLPGIVAPTHATAAFTKIYDFNFKKFDTGQHGIVNVMTTTGGITTGGTGNQAGESWVGTSWGVAAGMIQEGLTTQAAEIGQSLYQTIWKDHQLWFRTPEAWQTGVTSVRAQYYMRAPAIWAVKHAYDMN